MRPGTTVNWFDQSSEVSSVVAVESYESYPLFLTAFSSDKGPEDMRVVGGDDFFKLYGSNISFAKHGQPLLQAANIINNGGRLLAKRVVAPDASLANLAIIAKVTAEQVQKRNKNGELLYEDAVTGAETIVAEGNDPIMRNIASIKYETASVTDAHDIDDVKTEILKLINDEGEEVEIEPEISAYSDTDGEVPVDGEPTENPVPGEEENGGTEVEEPVQDPQPTPQPTESKIVYTYPLFVICDNGRGVSNKRFNIVGDYIVSKNLPFQMYTLNTVSNDIRESEYIRFALDQDIIYLGESLSLEMSAKNLTQIKGTGLADCINKFITKISEITGVDESILKGIDVIFGKDKRGAALDYIAIDNSGYQLNTEIGLNLTSGSNGSFGNAPFGTTSYTNELVSFFNGTFDDSIYDVDRYKIQVCCDANYPTVVKDAIVDLVNFREDFFFFRDFETTASTYYEICNYRKAAYKFSKFVGDYHIYGDIIDPYTKKQITVTGMYDISRLLVNHINTHITVPFCGLAYDAILSSFIEGTVNFVPKYLPTVDQKTQFSDMHINYASYLNNNLVLETEYTSQEKTTQLSYISNILNAQEVIRAVRTACPKFRYSFITQNDLEDYKKNVKDVLTQYAANFASLDFEYVQDPVMAANKIFQASIIVTFKDFAQTEVFNLYVLNA